MENHNDISNELKELEAEKLQELKVDMPEIPTINFEEIQASVMDKVSKEETKIIPLYKRSWFIGSLAVAASLLLVLSIYTPQEELSNPTSFNPSADIAIEVLEDEVDYLDEDMLAEAYADLVEEDISMYEEYLLEEDFDIDYLYNE